MLNPGIRALAIRLGGLCLLGVVIAELWLHRLWFAPEAIALRLGHHGWAPVAFLLVHVLVGLSFIIPRSVMGFAAGLLFGIWWGLALAMTGLLLGAWAAFGLVRLYRGLSGSTGGSLHLPLSARLRPWLERFDRAGWRAVWALRLMPLPHSPLSYGLGLTSVSWGAYTIGTLLGTLPWTVVFVVIGAAGGNAVSGRMTDWLVPLALGLGGLGASMVIPKLPMVRRLRNGMVQ